MQLFYHGILYSKIFVDQLIIIRICLFIFKNLFLLVSHISLTFPFIVLKLAEQLQTKPIAHNITRKEMHEFHK